MDNRALGMVHQWQQPVLQRALLVHRARRQPRFRASWPTPTAGQAARIEQARGDRRGARRDARPRRPLPAGRAISRIDPDGATLMVGPPAPRTSTTCDQARSTCDPWAAVRREREGASEARGRAKQAPEATWKGSPMKHILSVLVENKPGVLSRVTRHDLASRLQHRVAVGRPHRGRHAIAHDHHRGGRRGGLRADHQAAPQARQRLQDLRPHRRADAIERELVLFKVHATPERRHEIIEIANVFRAKVVDVGKNTLTIEATGDAVASSRPWKTSSAPTAFKPAHAHRQDRDVPRGTQRTTVTPCSTAPRRAAHPFTR